MWAKMAGRNLGTFCLLWIDYNVCVFVGIMGSVTFPQFFAFVRCIFVLLILMHALGKGVRVGEGKP